MPSIPEFNYNWYAYEDLLRFLMFIERNPNFDLNFWSKIKIVGNCWQWQASRDTSGYGNFGRKGKSVKAHRFTYELFKGKIPDGYDIDHLCKNRICVNPFHLEAVTHHENIKRGLTGKLNNHERKKTHCKKGHPYSGKNLKIDKYGRRICRACSNQYQRNKWKIWYPINREKYLSTKKELRLQKQMNNQKVM